MCNASGIIFGATALIYFIPADASQAISYRAMAFGAVVVFFLVVIWKRVKPDNLSFSKSVFFKMIRFGSKNYIQNLIGLLNLRMYLFILAAFTGSFEAGLFSIALLFVEGVRFIPNAVGSILLPKLARMDDDSASADFAARVSRNVLPLSLAVTLGLIILMEPIIRIIFGEQFLGMAASAQLMLVAAIGGTFYQVFTRYFTSVHKQTYSIISGLVGLVAGVVLSVLLVSKMGLLGVAWAFSASSVITGAMMLFFFTHNSGLRFGKAIVLDRDDILFFKNICLDIKLKITKGAK